MQRGVRLVKSVLVVLGLFVATGDWGHGNAEPITLISILSPPAGVALPLGQAVEVLCRVASPATRITLYANNSPVGTIQRGRAEPLVRFSWSPSTEGVSCLVVQAAGAGETPLGSDEHCLTILSPTASVRIHAEP